MKELERRVQRLEGRPDADGLVVVKIFGGFVDDDNGDLAHSPNTDLTYVRQPGETEAAFHDRAIAAARRAGARSIIFGGFSD